MVNYKNTGVGFQLRLIISVCLIIAFVIIGVVAYKNASKVLFDKTLTEHQNRIESLSQVLEGEFNTLLSSAEKLESAFRNGYLSGIYLETSEVEFKGHMFRDITHFGESLIGDTKLVDAFTRDTGAIATLFAPSGDDFIRVSTSLKNQAGERATGTLLGKNHPGYNNLVNGKPFYSEVELFGNLYLTYYAPIISSDSTLLGLSFIGLPVDQVTQEAFSKLGRITWGDTGYTFIVDNEDDHRGEFLFHPKWKKSDPVIQRFVDADGNQPLKDIFNESTGVAIYPHTVSGQTGDKYVVYTDVAGWNWKILGGTYVDEVTKESAELLKIIVVVSALVGVFTFLIVTYFLNRRIVKPLVQLTGSVERLGKGEVSLKIKSEDSNTKNEIFRLTNGVSTMASQLDSLVSEIRQTSDLVSSQAQSVSNDANQSLQQSEAQQMRVEQVVTAIEEMATSAQSVAEQVESIALNAKEADESSQSGMSLVEKMCIDISDLNDLLDSSAEAIESVAKESESIQAVTKMIDEIADQTNLLALNAAIEAARAGEHGRGFAVVADEVRTLAHRTQNSVQEVVSIIGHLKTSTSGAVELMKTSQENANLVIEQAGEAGMALESIVEQVGSISSQSETIAATSEEQAQVSQEIAENVSDISELNEQTRDVSSQTSQSSETLKRQSSDLKHQVDFFS
ncbi:methyl-accepting chemotaxis protein [Vibrio algarum]|uniref:Cache 3/Cache 2 fusion domain-containing protein n=1 Tax=Vibrio algarum TaxID=3020714 RepID=A0ABT4YXB7_9VIBR|nr:Cache 3/Cache 2 fusion domain-containing protein [Vibrio sp. KJ40-1]MDB1126196.1 Cache 3/Cache 2 fusion domain-containing protein [Vibrio sp. KJ40-1]